MNTVVPNEYQIRQTIADWQRGICLKNIDIILDHYADDVVLFDTRPPFQQVGLESVKKVWVDSFPYFPAYFDIETSEMKLQLNGNLASAHWLWRLKNSDLDGILGQPWYRNTCTYRQTNGKWLITHEHTSLPFDPETNKAITNGEKIIKLD